jgi:hypothetical protein
MEIWWHVKGAHVDVHQWDQKQPLSLLVLKLCAQHSQRATVSQT